MKDSIIVRGAREHNLKNISLEIPRDSLTVITGISGSGKSTLAFDTIYAEGQRRYVESLSTYARQFLGMMGKPDVDSIEGLSPAISIEQRTSGKNPRSTVGTMTEIYDYMRLLWARVGKPHCPKCGTPIASQSPQAIVENIMKGNEGQKLEILSPVVQGKKGEYAKLLERLSQKGFSRARVDGETVEISQISPLKKQQKHTIEVLVDRVAVIEAERSRIFEAVQAALKESGGLVIAKIGKEERLFSQKNACLNCGISVGELEPRMFSFNSPYGACEECHGLGVKMEFIPELVMPDMEKCIAEGGIAPWQSAIGSYRGRMLEALGKRLGFDMFTPLKEIGEENLKVILYGTSQPIKYKFKSRNGNSYFEYEGGFEGVIPNLERLYRETKSEWRREEIAKFIRESACPKCSGKRLRQEILAVRVEGKSIMDVCGLPIGKAAEFFGELKLEGNELVIASPVLKEIRERLGFLVNVGVPYLTLSRISGTLSSGEMQRIRLATQIGSMLTGVVYVLDEPSIGLHQRDNGMLISTLKSLRDLGNTLLVVEHDEETMRNADFLVDMGPGAGEAGGRIVVAGSLKDVEKCEESLTGKYLARRLKIPVPKKRRASGRMLTVRGCQENNLKNIDVSFPLGTFTCITGVSGSGKSTLINETLYKGLAQKIYGSRERAGVFLRFEGLDYIDKAVCIDQNPIGRTPRSNPATYTGVFTPIRELFAKTPAARIKGYSAGKFSFNVEGGRCEKCEGAGVQRIEMNFLPDIFVPCEECKGKRYNSEALSITYKERNISDVLSMSVDEAAKFFENIPQVREKLKTLQDVGLGYIKLGQSATTLSGGEAQRVKLSSELSKRGTGKTMYILDEPTVGLHFADVAKLLDVLVRLVEKENTVIVIEHNLEVIKSADYIIDLGPEGGEEGGRVVATGTPEEVAQNNKSWTGEYLKGVLGSVKS